MENKPTHRAIIEVTSYKDDPEVKLEVKWEPAIDDEDIEDQGYVPAAYHFVEQVLIATEIASTGLIEFEEEDLDENRTLN